MFLDNLNPFNQSSAKAEGLLKRQLQWLLFLRVLLLTVFLGISGLLQYQDRDLIIPPLRYLFYFIGGIYCFSIASALFLQKTKHLKHFAFLQIFIDSLIVSTLIFFTGSSQSIFTLMNFLPIIAGGILLYLSGGLFIAAVTTFNFGGILLLEFLGYHARFFPDFNSPLTSIEILLHHFAIPGVTFFLVGLLTSLLSGRLQQTEEALSRASQDLDRLSLLYKQIFDDITTGIITVNSKGEITSFNRAAEKITGFPAHEVIDLPIQTKLPELKLEKKEAMRPVANLTRKDGEIIPVGYSWTRLNMPGDTENCRIYTMQDLSRIKKMEDRIRQAEKMAAIGRMAAGIAHEFRNPLAAISGAAQVLHHELSDDAATQGLMNIIIRESDRLEGTISEFLQFSRPATPEKSWFSLHGLVNETIDILKQAPSWNKKIKFKTNIPGQLDAWADADQTKQIFLNLFSNAANALGENQGSILIKAREMSDKKQNDQTRIVISDTGPGIPEKIRNKIFEPFYTTRENGTGLGLAIVRQIIESNGGTIELSSGPKKNEAIFVLDLPLP